MKKSAFIRRFERDLAIGQEEIRRKVDWWSNAIVFTMLGFSLGLMLGSILWKNWP